MATTNNAIRTLTYSEAIEAWAGERELLGYVEPFTARKARQKALLFAPFIGESPLEDVSQQEITKALVNLGTTGGRRGTGLSSATLRAAHLAATQAYDWAMRNALTSSNPFRAVPRPRANYRQSTFLTSEQAASLNALAVECARDCMERTNTAHVTFALAVCTALATGLRRGEIFALGWDDVDLKRRCIAVNKAIKADGKLGLPKSRASIRNVAIGSGLVGLLEEVHMWQQRHLTEPPGRILCKDDGSPGSMNAFGHWWRAWAKSQGHDGLRFHELRHTHATLLIASGADVKTVQTRLGHSSAEVTMSIYAHAIPQSDGLVAAALDSALFA